MLAGNAKWKDKLAESPVQPASQVPLSKILVVIHECF